MRSKPYSFAALISILILSLSYAGQFNGGLVNNSQKLFAIQLLASRDKSLANEIVKILKDRSFHAYLTETEKDETIWYRVRIGPFKNRQDAENTLSLANKFFSDAYIVKEKLENIEYLSKTERQKEKKSSSNKQPQLQTTEGKKNYTNRVVTTQQIEKVKGSEKGTIKAKSASKSNNESKMHISSKDMQVEQSNPQSTIGGKFENLNAGGVFIGACAWAKISQHQTFSGDYLGIVASIPPDSKTLHLDKPDRGQVKILRYMMRCLKS